MSFNAFQDNSNYCICDDRKHANTLPIVVFKPFPFCAILIIIPSSTHSLSLDRIVGRYDIFFDWRNSPYPHATVTSNFIHKSWNFIRCSANHGEMFPSRLKLFVAVVVKSIANVPPNTIEILASTSKANL